MDRSEFTSGDVPRQHTGWIMTRPAGYSDADSSRTMPQVDTRTAARIGWLMAKQPDCVEWMKREGLSLQELQAHEQILLQLVVAILNQRAAAQGILTDEVALADLGESISESPLTAENVQRALERLHELMFEQARQEAACVLCVPGTRVHVVIPTQSSPAVCS